MQLLELRLTVKTNPKYIVPFPIYLSFKSPRTTATATRGGLYDSIRSKDQNSSDFFIKKLFSNFLISSIAPDISNLSKKNLTFLNF